MARGKAAGIARERKVRDLLLDEGWLPLRSPASIGAFDVMAIKHGERPRLIEVKSNAGGPWEGFRRPERIALYDLAKRFGADAYLCWWPPRSEPKWIPASDWPPPV